MNAMSTSIMKLCTVVFTVLLLVACAASTEIKTEPEPIAETGEEASAATGQTPDTQMTFGNSENVKVIENPVMMFHEIIVTPAAGGAELVGKIHVRRHTRYVPGHIDIAVVDNSTKEVLLQLSTDFNHRIAETGYQDLSHPNNMGAELPGVDPAKVTVYVAYHPSNIDRKSRFDCGENAAVAAIKEMEQGK
jgi:hypothetical protein